MTVDDEKILLIRGLLLNWLELRKEVLCVLSAEDREWWERGSGSSCIENLGLMRSLIARAFFVADNLPGSLPPPYDDSQRTLIWSMLDELAKEHGHAVVVNWNVPLDSTVKEASVLPKNEAHAQDMALDYAIRLIESYQSEIHRYRIKTVEGSRTLEEAGFCQGVLYRDAIKTIRKMAEGTRCGH